MRLFNRRREMEFDDPRLVGMSPLNPTEENSMHPKNVPRSTLVLETKRPADAEDVHLTFKKSQELADKPKMTNVSTWKRVSRPWDSLKRSESSEHLSRSVISNRRKTLHFYPEEDKFDETSLSRIPISCQRVSTQLKQQNDTIVSNSPKRKIGRVESLRLLLSRPNRLYKGKAPNPKQDKGTDTVDLDTNEMEHFNSLYNISPEDDDIAHSSKYSSISNFFQSSTLTQIRNSQYSHNLSKTTSCENLSLQNVNQSRTLPGRYRDMSTSTSSTPFLDSSCLSPQTTTSAKRSSFPYAYIRSRLTSLQEEPKKSSTKSLRVSASQDQDQKQVCLLSSNFMHKGFYHSMGNLLSETNNKDHSSAVDDDHQSSDNRNFDPLKQIRIDLLHCNPSEIDEQSSSPTFWGRRSYSIGDMLEKRKIGKRDSGNGVEESGYDSDSTRNGNESPRNSSKSPSSETDNETEQCTNSQSAKANVKLETDSLDSETHSNNEIFSESNCSYPSTGGCLITIGNNIINNQPLIPSRTPSVNGFRKGENGVIIEVTDEIDESEDIDCYSATTEGALEIGAEDCRKSNSCIGKSVTNDDGKILEKSVIMLNPTTPQIVTQSLSTKKEELQKTAPSLRLRNRVRDKDREWNCIKPSRSKSLCLSIFTVTFNKGPKKKSLGFSVIGGIDSPVPGIFIKRIFPYGQASEEGTLTEGDEILSVNGQPLANSTHAEALNIFKSIKNGNVQLEVARREFLSSSNQTLKRQYSQLSSKSCEQLYYSP